MIDYNDYVEEIKNEMGPLFESSRVQRIDLEEGYDYSWLMDVKVKNSLKTILWMVAMTAQQGLSFHHIKLVKIEDKNCIVLGYYLPPIDSPEQPFTPIADQDDQALFNKELEGQFEGIPLLPDSEWGNASEETKDAALEKLSKHLNGDSDVA